jgi:hypothetical protein
LVSKIAAHVNEDLLSARINIDREGATQFGFDMDADELDEAIATLARVRSRMQPEIPLKLEPLDIVLPLFDYRWYVDGFRQSGRRTVALRHPAFGWLAFAMPDGDAANFASWLTKSLPDSDAC